MRRPVLAAFVTFALLAVAVPARAELPPLGARAAALLAAIEPDPKPKELSADSHFLVSDEKRHDLFAASIAGVGGALVGVGTDPVYLFAGWARSELVIPMDFDQWVVDLHRAYGVAFHACATPAEFLAFWGLGEPEAMASVAAVWPAEADQAAARRMFKLARQLVRRKLRATVALHEKLEVASYLNDQAQYDHVRALWRLGRVRPVRGDLTAKTTMQQVGAALTELGVPVRVFYPSNAEKYFPYSKQVVRNYLALPFDERSWVLRTQGRGEDLAVELDGFYVYELQSGLNLRAWFSAPRPPWNVHVLHRARAKTATPGYFTIEALPPPPKPPKPPKKGR